MAWLPQMSYGINVVLIHLMEVKQQDCEATGRKILLGYITLSQPFNNPLPSNQTETEPGEIWSGLPDLSDKTTEDLRKVGVAGCAKVSVKMDRMEILK